MRRLHETEPSEIISVRLWKQKIEEINSVCKEHKCSRAVLIRNGIDYALQEYQNKEGCDTV